jgi:hypothetical protein
MKWIFVFVLFFSGDLAFSDCSSPAGKEGQFEFLIFSAPGKHLHYCNGTNWVRLNINGSSSCVGQTQGKVEYNAGTIRVCGTSKESVELWFDTKGINLGSCAGTTAGTWGYDPTTRYPRFCDGTNWYSMRSRKGIRVTTYTMGANLGGLSGADAICQADAIAGAETGTWIAWLSSSTTHAKDRVLGEGPWHQYSAFDGGGLVASTKADLIDGTLTGAIYYDFTEVNLGDYSPYFTGTDSTGNATANTCSDWTTNSSVRGVGPYYTSGWTGFADATWTNTGTPALCGNMNRRLLCIEI